MTEFVPGSELEIVPLNEENVTGYGFQEVELFGRKIRIHQTNNFMAIIGAYLEIQRGGDIDPYAQAYDGVLKTPPIPEILEELSTSYPKLFTKMTEYSDLVYLELKTRSRVIEAHGRDSSILRKLIQSQYKSKEEIAYREWIFSMGWDALVESAKRVDPDFTLGKIQPLTGYNPAIERT